MLPGNQNSKIQTEMKCTFKHTPGSLTNSSTHFCLVF
uniref:Uncharacterized protein n=1 Tax=Arundo donax TaxID=35708 RepID=A0A0A9DDZ5_ARUDO